MNRNIFSNGGKHLARTAHDPDAGLTEADVLPRRIVLRGALAAGFGLLLPAALMGCDSKPESNTAGSDTPPPTPGPESAESAPTADTAAAAPAEPAKATQASVQYQTQPKGTQKCASCVHFLAESNTCKLVEGTINPEGWCTLWTGQT
jgi:hypothetical protein